MSLAQRHGVEMPVCSEVDRVLTGEVPASEAYRGLSKHQQAGLAFSRYAGASAVRRRERGRHPPLPLVHGTAMSPVILREDVTEHTWHTVAGVGRRWADGVDRPGDRRNTITIHWVGVGFAYNAEQTP